MTLAQPQQRNRRSENLIEDTLDLFQFEIPEEKPVVAEVEPTGKIIRTGEELIFDTRALFGVTEEAVSPLAQPVVPKGIEDEDEFLRGFARPAEAVPGEEPIVPSTFDRFLTGAGKAVREATGLGRKEERGARLLKAIAKAPVDLTRQAASFLETFQDDETTLLRGVGTPEGSLLGNATRIIAPKIGRFINQKTESLSKKLEIEDPAFTEKLAGAGASTLFFFTPGLGTMNAALMARATPRIAALIGASTSGVLEAAVESGGTYERSLQKGRPIEQARKDAAKVFYTNIPVNTILNRFIFTRIPEGRKLKSVIGNMSAEGSQEAIQQLIANTAVDDPALAGVGESALIGSLVGGGVTVAGIAVQPRPMVEEFEIPPRGFTRDFPGEPSPEAPPRPGQLPFPRALPAPEPPIELPGEVASIPTPTGPPIRLPGAIGLPPVTGRPPVIGRPAPTTEEAIELPARVELQRQQELEERQRLIEEQIAKEVEREPVREPAIPREEKAEEVRPAEERVRDLQVEGIPEFRTTEEAVSFGKTATEGQLQTLETERDRLDTDISTQVKARNIQEAINLSARSQLIREAIESKRGDILLPETKIPKGELGRITSQIQEEQSNNPFRILKDFLGRSRVFVPEENRSEWREISKTVGLNFNFIFKPQPGILEIDSVASEIGFEGEVDLLNRLRDVKAPLSQAEIRNEAKLRFEEEVAEGRRFKREALIETLSEKEIGELLDPNEFNALMDQINDPKNPEFIESHTREELQDAIQEIRKRTKRVVEVEAERPAAKPAKPPAEAREERVKQKRIRDELDSPDDFATPETNAQKGFIRVATEKAKDRISFRPFTNFIRKYFTKEGNFPKEVFRSLEKRKGALNRRLFEIDVLLKEFRKVTKGRRTPKERFQHDAFLKGEPIEGELSQDVESVLSSMRAHTDGTSLELRESGAVQGELKAIISENLGFWLHRSYRIFDDPKWANRVPVHIRSEAKALVRDEYKKDILNDKGEKIGERQLTENELEAVIEELLFKGENANTPISIMASGSKIGSKALGILKKRKRIPKEIRALWGEYKEADVNYAKSVEKMAALIENHKFLTEIKDKGMGNFFFTEATVVGDQKFVKQIAAEGSKVFEPLNGIYTTKEIAEAFENHNRVNNSWMLQVYMKINGLVKFNKTVGSHVTHLRNFFSNTGFAVAQGHWRVGKFKDAAKATSAELLRKSDSEYLDYIKRLKELGVLGEAVAAGEIKDVIADAAGSDFDSFFDRNDKNIFKKVGSIAVNLYQAEDGFWKIFAFENEKARYGKALPKFSENQIEKISAEIVKSTYPDYSRVPEAIKLLRRFPFAGTFVSFPWEVMRTSTNTINLINKEVKNPKLRKIGVQRLIGAIFAATLIPSLVATLNHILGVSDDDDENLREFVAPWTKNSNIAWISKNGLKYSYVDFSYTDPHAYLRKPLIAFLRGENWQSKVYESGVEAMTPFFSEEILAQALIDVRRNKTKRGTRVYNPQDSLDDRMNDIMGHVWKGVEPGTITSMRRLHKSFEPEKTTVFGRRYDPKIEAVANITPFRVSQLELPISFRFRAGDFRRALNDARRAGKREEIEPKRVAIAKTFIEFQRVVNAARALGMPETQIKSILKDVNISAKDAKFMLNGRLDLAIKRNVESVEESLERRIKKVRKKRGQ